MAEGVLVLAATPIGDPRDAAPRLAQELREADIVAAEDTRRLRRLMDALEITTSAKIISYHEHNEASRSTELVDTVARGGRVVVVTDAGMPSVSDPGYRVVADAVTRDLRITCVPGPSAVLMALAVSGLPVDRFCFEGFLSRKAGERSRQISDLAAERRTMVFFEAPHRLADMLEALADGLGADRRAAVCRELTKTYEEIKRGGLADLAQWAVEHARGEITVVVEGAPAVRTTLEDAVPQVLELVAEGERLKDAAAAVAQETGLSKKALYDAALAAR